MKEYNKRPEVRARDKQRYAIRRATVLAQKKEYYKKQRARILAYRADLRTTQPEHVKAIKRQSYQRHRERHLSERRTYYQQNRERVIRRTRDHSLKLRGLNGGFREKQERWQQQDGRCAMCGLHLPKEVGKCHADHCHETGKFRGLIHPRCNIFLGWLEKHPEMIEFAKEYLAR